MDAVVGQAEHEQLAGRPPWRLRLQLSATVHSWCCVLVRPRRSDCVVMFLGLLCFFSSLSLEVVLLLRCEYRNAWDASTV